MSDLSNQTFGNLIIYQTDDGQSRIECRMVEQTVWLSQAQMGELFDRSKQTISEHLRNIFEEAELSESSVSDFGSSPHGEPNSENGPTPSSVNC